MTTLYIALVDGLTIEADTDSMIAAAEAALDHLGKARILRLDFDVETGAPESFSDVTEEAFAALEERDRIDREADAMDRETEAHERARMGGHYA